MSEPLPSHTSSFISDLIAAGMLRQIDRRLLAIVAAKTARAALDAGDIASARLFLDEVVLQLGRAEP